MAKQKVKFTKVELKEFEKLLTTKKDHTKAQLKDLENQLQELAESGYEEKGDDQSAYDSQVSFLVTHIARSKKHLNDIEKALHRIEMNTYGVCTVTGNLINKKRLLAVPTTTKSLEAKNSKLIS